MKELAMQLVVMRGLAMWPNNVCMEFVVMRELVV